jgi:hypothetical protein
MPERLRSKLFFSQNTIATKTIQFLKLAGKTWTIQTVASDTNTA